MAWRKIADYVRLNVPLLGAFVAPAFRYVGEAVGSAITEALKGIKHDLYEGVIPKLDRASIRISNALSRIKGLEEKVSNIITNLIPDLRKTISAIRRDIDRVLIPSIDEARRIVFGLKQDYTRFVDVVQKQWIPKLLPLPDRLDRMINIVKTEVIPKVIKIPEVIKEILVVEIEKVVKVIDTRYVVIKEVVEKYKTDYEVDLSALRTELVGYVDEQIPQALIKFINDLENYKMDMETWEIIQPEPPVTIVALKARMKL